MKLAVSCRRVDIADMQAKLDAIVVGALCGFGVGLRVYRAHAVIRDA